MKWGTSEKALQALVDSGKKIRAIENKPQIDSSLLIFWRGFAFLSSSRQMGMGANPLQLSEIIACCDLFGIYDRDDRAEFVTIIQAMDRTLLDWYEAEKGKGKKNPTRR